jgi:hypothetical protein
MVWLDFKFEESYQSDYTNDLSEVCRCISMVNLRVDMQVKRLCTIERKLHTFLSPISSVHLLLLHRRPKPTVKARIRVPRPRAPLDRHTSIRRPHVNRLRVLLRFGVNTNIDCSIEAILNRFSDQRDLHDGVVAALLGHVEERVSGVGGDGLLVGVVGGCLLDLAHEGLVDVELSHVRDGTALDGVVGEELGTMVDDSWAY